METPLQRQRRRIDMTLSEITHLFSSAQELAYSGKLLEAESLLMEIYREDPGLFPPLVLLAQIKEALGKPEEALPLYEAAIRLVPGHALPFTRRALILLRRAYPLEGVSKSLQSGQPLVTMRSLGLNGRFGNQLLQYGYLSLYARRCDAQVCVPDWIGRDLYGLSDPFPPSNASFEDMSEPEVLEVLAGHMPEKTGVNLSGYFCGDTALLSGEREHFRACFLVAPTWLPLVAQWEATLRDKGNTLVVLHLRRGDFGQGPFWIAPNAWYLDWLSAHWSGLEKPVLYIATDDDGMVADFAAYAPVTGNQLQAPILGAEFFVDHSVMRVADYLLISNSTFSATAALLSERGGRCYRPDRVTGQLRTYDPWASPVLIQQEDA